MVAFRVESKGSCGGDKRENEHRDVDVLFVERGAKDIQIGLRARH